MKRKGKRWIYPVLVIMVVALMIGLTASAQGEYLKVTPEEAKTKLEAEGGRYVDVRTEEEYDEAHIPGAVRVTLDEIGDTQPQALAELDEPLYVYCRTGVRSRQASEKLISLGYTKVYDMGGIVDWPYETISTQEEQAEQAAQPEESEVRFLQSFTATDLNGNAVDQSLFANHKLTMINIWATYCGPCLNEMPDLGKLSEAYKDKGVQIVGIVSDAANYDGAIDENQVAFAQEIVEQTGANYPHLLPSEDLINIVLWQVSAVPTTIFVDETGALVGYAYTGSAPYESWAERIESTLSSL